MGRGRQAGDHRGRLERPAILFLTADEQGWLTLAARKLRRLDGAPGRSWRSDAAARLEQISNAWERQVRSRPDESHAVQLQTGDPSLFDQVAFELAAEENARALAEGSVTWQTIAADHLADLAIRARSSQH